MNRPIRRSMIRMAVLTTLAALSAPLAAEEAESIQWSGRDIHGNELAVPGEEKVAALVYVMADQKRSVRAMRLVQKELTGAGGVERIAVVSGEEAAKEAGTLAEKSGWTGSIVADEAYRLSGAGSVHVWPTVVIVDDGGRIVGHVAGLPASLPKDVKAYVDFAAGRIDRDALEAALKSEDYVTSSQQQAAARHMEVARRLIDRQQYEQAAQELDQALELSPDDPTIKLARARLRVLQGEPTEALKELDALDTGKLPVWQVQTLRGRALLDLDRVDQARQTLSEAVKLNPRPAEAYYLLGRTLEIAERWEEAADAYRSAYEHAAENATTPAEAE